MKLLEQLRNKVDTALGQYLPAKGLFPKPIHQAMRYSVMAGGKRLRPILALLTGRMLGAPENKTMPAACSLELVHTYSLIHDDLPAMDNDDLRRGKPTCHKVYGEAMAILAGDALLTYAFQLIADKTADKKLVPALVSELAVASGSTGMIGGQVLDIAASGKNNRYFKSLDSLNLCGEIHLRKTAMMITASCRMGAIIAGADKASLDRVTGYGQNLGLAFQIVDDILDVVGEKNQLGKTPGKDQAQHKLTYPALKGIKSAEAEAIKLITTAKSNLKPFGSRAKQLTELADYIVSRQS
ncbi:MAG: farnesyl diphosphate synthase [Planctomycetota bacterium]